MQNASLMASLCPTPHRLPVPTTRRLSYSGRHWLYAGSHPVPKGGQTPPNLKSSSSPSSARRDQGIPCSPVGEGRHLAHSCPEYGSCNPIAENVGFLCLFFFSLLIIKLGNEADEWSPTRDGVGVVVEVTSCAIGVPGLGPNFPVCNTWGGTGWQPRSPL